MDINSLAHTKWNCKYHIVFEPKYRRKIIYGQLKRDLGNFHFKEGGQNYHSVGEVDEIQVIIQDSGSVKHLNILIQRIGHMPLCKMVNLSILHFMMKHTVR